MNNKANITAFHLYNDFSGSPKVLATVLLGLAKKGYTVDLLSSSNGALDAIFDKPNIAFKEVPYKFHADSKLKTIFNYISANLRYFGHTAFSLKRKNEIVYVNTILPFGAALGARLRRIPVIYHYHENAHTKGRIYGMLSRIMEKLAGSIICVSKTQASTLKRKENVFIVPNGLTQQFLSALTPDPDRAFEEKNILMLSSIKSFKGVDEFCKLARMLPQLSFTLVLNDSEENCKEFEKRNNCREIPNLKIHSRSNDVADFYNHASVVVNLSDKRQVVETFGLTVIEGMAAGLPAIVPTVGGPAELVRDGYNGFQADVENLLYIKQKLEYIFSSREIYTEMSRHARESAREYTAEAMIERISHIIDASIKD